ncbi:MAG: hypothetical protein COA74_00870 [Gammaproteobacteria bacterium]|nr:MAG: hypothetical protein COA74_00870 [Gammaproteobacteria bacterium]
MKIIVCALAHLENSPRPNRMVRLLKNNHELTYAGFSSNMIDIDFIKIPKKKNLYVRMISLLFKVFRLHKFISRISYHLNIDANMLEQFDVIICHDIQLMPYFEKVNPSCRIVLDLREFYPRQFENDFLWSFLEKPFQHYLCEKYLPKAHQCITVSSGLKTEYKNIYHIDAEIVHSVAPKSELVLKLNTGKPIKLIYHGIANKARRIKSIIEAMDSVKSEAHLDLMVVGNKRYIDELKRMARDRNNVSVLSPVAYKKIVEVTNDYDVGVIFLPPSTFNLQHCLPNKLFEMIQAKVPIITSPLTELKTFILKYDIGWVTSSFDKKTLVKLINQLNHSSINIKKLNVDKVSSFLNQEYANDDLSLILLGSSDKRPEC